MQKRLLKELKQFKENPTPNIFIEDTDDLRLWRVNLIGTENSLYAGEKFMLQFVFPNDYPMEAPEVIFVQNPAKNIIIPKHPHIYSNGHICLDVLYSGWSPVLTASSLAISILSMLSSATEKVPPKDNDMYVANCHGRSPKSTRWWFHDDKV
eukprot:GEZU01012618.1.p1 GENE.GEZU01012618.1~~GEZU01012618.1.p1  ORF type:complete len:152 (-),score=17.20 GEZU01012618.1:112-567(-)